MYISLLAINIIILINSTGVHLNYHAQNLCDTELKTEASYMDDGGRSAKN